MYKMKEVCAMTGLTEKTVRFYMEQKLITPKTEPGLHYRSYRFSPEDVQRLRDISALRGAEFTIAEIRQMLADPASIAPVVAEKERSLAEKVAALETARRNLGELTLAEQRDVSQLADALEPRSPLRQETPKPSRNRLFWLGGYTLLFLVLGLLITGGKKPWLVLYVLALLGGMEFPLMALGYFRYNRRCRRLPCRGEATVVSIISDEGVDREWEETDWQILLQRLHFGFVHWNWVRPDHWVPLVQFEAEGETVTAVYRYGGLKRSWKPGDRCPVAWEAGKPVQIWPCKDPVIERKAWCYLLGGMALWGFFFTGFAVLG